MTGKRTRSFKCAVHHRDREICSENDFHVITHKPPIRKRARELKILSLFSFPGKDEVCLPCPVVTLSIGRMMPRLFKIVAKEFLTHHRDRKYFVNHFHCFPPPCFILTVAILELICFILLAVNHKSTLAPAGIVPIASSLTYRPDLRHEIWRFFTYSFLHSGWWHFSFNFIVQLFIGLPLELVHGSARVGTVYAAGILAGSLLTSVCDTRVYLVGANGGTYALLAAHMANVLLNYSYMDYSTLRIFLIFIFTSFDLSIAIYYRYAQLNLKPATSELTVTLLPPIDRSVTYVSHLAGVLTGLSVGLVTVQNYEQRLYANFCWGITIGCYLALGIFITIYNMFNRFPYKSVFECWR